MFWIFSHEACGIFTPWPGIEPAPPALEGEILTTGPPGKSPRTMVFVVLVSLTPSTALGLWWWLWKQAREDLYTAWGWTRWFYLSSALRFQHHITLPGQRPSALSPRAGNGCQAATTLTANAVPLSHYAKKASHLWAFYRLCKKKKKPC